MLPPGSSWTVVWLTLDEMGDARKKLNDRWFRGTVNIDDFVHVNTMRHFYPLVKSENEKSLFGRVFRHTNHTVYGMFGNDVSFDATAFDRQFTKVIGASDVS